MYLVTLEPSKDGESNVKMFVYKLVESLPFL